MSATFLYALCRSGSEPALKRDVAVRLGGQLTPAFMRPQLITWKALDGAETSLFDSGFALVAGRTVGKATTAGEVVSLVQAAGITPQRLQVLPREAPEEGVSEETWGRVSALGRALAEALAVPHGGRASPGETVLDIIAGTVAEPWLVGVRKHRDGAFPDVEELLRVALPEAAPSRAWLKMEQALRWLGKDSALAGATVLELGSAPGGGSLCLLDHGATVYGVDTGAMDPRVLAYPTFHHLRVAAGDLQREMVPRQVDVLASDMNLEPRVVCQYAEKFASRLRPAGLILTLKLNTPQVEASLPTIIDRVRRWAPGPVDVRQLPANRREITLVSWAENDRR